MLIIRLQRVGRKNDPSFRIIITDSHRAAKTGKVLEVVGDYNARSAEGGQARPPKINVERVKHWLSMGAKVSGTVHNLLIDAKVISGKKINVLPRRQASLPQDKINAKIEPEALVEEKAELQA
jgi:small subunit ribosomal protein S16